VYTKTVDFPVPGFRKYWKQKLGSLKSECHTITNKCPEAASVVQQVYKVLNDIERFWSDANRPKWEESSECTNILNSTEEKRETFAKL
jgi:hypothetical protein